MKKYRRAERIAVMVASLIVASGCGEQAKDEAPLVIVPDDMIVAPDAPEATDQGEDMAPDEAPDEAPDLERGCPAHGLPASISAQRGAIFEVRAAAGHTITALDGEGMSAWAADGVWSARSDYGAAQRVLRAQVQCEGGAESVEVGVELSWAAARVFEGWGGAGPASREHAMLWTDGADPDGLYLYGGYGFRPRQFTVLTDLWRLDLETGVWGAVEAMGEAPPFGGMRGVYRAGAHELVLVGGDAPLTRDANTRTYKLSMEPSPAWSREERGGEVLLLGALLYDEATQRLRWVLGLSGASPVFNAEILELGAQDGAWQRSTPAGEQPDGRYGFAYFVDEARDELVVFGGGRYPTVLSPVNPARDVWALSMETWTWREIEAQGTPAPGGRNACWGFDPVNRRLFVFGGTSDGSSADAGFMALHLDGDAASWHDVPTEGLPRARASCSATYSAGRGELIFGFGNDQAGAALDLFSLKVHDAGE